MTSLLQTNPTAKTDAPTNGVASSDASLLRRSVNPHGDDVLSELIAGASIAIALSDLTGVIASGNAAFLAVAGLVEGGGPKRLQDLVCGEDQVVLERMLTIARHEGCYGPISLRLLEQPNATALPVRMQGFVVIGRDGARLWSIVSDGVQSAEPLGHVARVEQATPETVAGVDGLPLGNPLGLGLEKAIENASTERRKLALVLIHLNGFDLVSDTLGAAVGDAVFKEVGKRLKRTVRSRDFVARVSANSFGLAMSNLQRRSDVETMSARLIDAISAAMPAPADGIRLGAHIGVSLYPEHGKSAKALAWAADIALRTAKGSDRNKPYVFDPSMVNEAKKRFNAVTTLQAAIAENRIVPVYQRIVDLKTETTAAFEVLLRVRGDDGGLLPPSLPMLAEPALRCAIDDYMFGLVVDQMAGWIASGIAPPHVSVNLSGPALWDAMSAGRLSAALAERSVPADRILIEITENLFLGADTERTTSVMLGLCREGFRFALDDFGTGHASLTHLKALPISEVKIDRTFINDIETNPRSGSIVTSLIDLCHSLGKSVVAEGIESRRQKSILTNLGCDFGQGFLLGHPFEAAEAEAHLTREASRRARTIRHASHNPLRP